MGQISELLRPIKESYCNVKLKWPVTGQHTVIIKVDVLQVLYKQIVWLKDFLKKPENLIYFNLSLGRKKRHNNIHITTFYPYKYTSKLHIHINDHKLRKELLVGEFSFIYLSLCFCLSFSQRNHSNYSVIELYRT